VAAYTALTKDLPDPSQIEALFQRANSEFFETTKIYDRTGKTLLYEVIDPRAGDRQWVALSQIPPLCRQAAIAIDNARLLTNLRAANLSMETLIDSSFDAVIAMEGDGPIMGRPRSLGLLAMSTDPVALATARMGSPDMADTENPLFAPSIIIMFFGKCSAKCLIAPSRRVLADESGRREMRMLTLSISRFTSSGGALRWFIFARSIPQLETLPPVVSVIESMVTRLPGLTSEESRTGRPMMSTTASPATTTSTAVVAALNKMQVKKIPLRLLP
jgi:hypothetical protein